MHNFRHLSTLQKFGGSLIAIVVLGVGVFLFYSQETLSQYSSEAYGVSFEYPDTYVLEEREVGSGERLRHSITLVSKSDAAEERANSEGPTAITVDIFQNNLDQDPVADWILKNSFSNFKLSVDGVLTPETVDGAPAFSYTWDGLYRGDSVVFPHKEKAVHLNGRSLSHPYHVLAQTP